MMKMSFETASVCFRGPNCDMDISILHLGGPSGRRISGIMVCRILMLVSTIVVHNSKDYIRRVM